MAVIFLVLVVLLVLLLEQNTRVRAEDDGQSIRSNEDMLMSQIKYKFGAGKSKKLGERKYHYY